MKKTPVIMLIILIICGSFINFYCTNLVLSDVSNMYYAVHDVTFLSSIPGLMLAIEFVAATLLTLRYSRRPQFKKRTALLYLRIFAVLSIIGVIGAALAGLMVYGNFAAPYPFAGYTIISIIVHAAIVVVSIVAGSKIRKNMEDDSAKRRVDFGYVIYSSVISILIYLAYNRLGALMWGFTYIQARSFAVTFPFYISLLLPMALMLHVILYFYGKFDKNPVIAITYDIIFLVVDLVLGFIVISTGRADTEFVSAISPALAIERLITMPVDIIFHFVVLLLIGIYCLYLSIKLKHEKEKMKADA